MNSVVDLLRRGARLHHHGCDVQDFSRQLRTASQDQRRWKNIRFGRENFSETAALTLLTTLMPSMSSADRVLICDVPFRNRSDSEIPAWRTEETASGWADSGETLGLAATLNPASAGPAGLFNVTGDNKAAGWEEAGGVASFGCRCFLRATPEWRADLRSAPASDRSLKAQLVALNPHTASVFST